MKFNYLIHSNVNHSISQVSIMLTIFMFIILMCGCKPATEKVSTTAPTKPVAVKTHIEPTEKYPFASVTRIEYAYAVLRVSEDWYGYSRVTDKRMFINLETAWPDFGHKKYYSKSAPVDKVRFLFEVEKRNTFNNLYHVFMDRKEESRRSETR